MNKLAQEYNSQGYVKVSIPAVIPQINVMESNLVKIISKVAQSFKMNTESWNELSNQEIINKYLPIIYKTKPSAFSFIYDSVRYHSDLLQLVSSKEVLEVCQTLYPENERGNQTNISQLQIVMQRPNDDIFINGIHQDSGFFSEYASSDSSMVVWLNMFDCNKEHGTIEVIPRSHLKGRIPHTKNEWNDRRKGERNSKGSVYIDEGSLSKSDIDSLVPIECKRGDVLFMHYDLVHRSGINTSNDMRITFLSRNTNLFGSDYIPKYQIW